MSGVRVTVGSLAEFVFEVYDSANQPVLGASGFTTLLSRDGVDSAVTVTVSEIANGRYLASFTPNASGDWFIVVRHATYNLRGWQEEFQAPARGRGGSEGGNERLKRLRQWDRAKARERERARESEDDNARRAAILIAVMEADDDE